MTLLHWLVFVLLLFIGGSAILCNWVLTFRQRGSYVPILGGVTVAFAFLLTPVEALFRFWWIPLFVDLGCLPIVLPAVGCLVWKSLFSRKVDHK